MQLQNILFSQGFGTRRVCAGLVQQGFVQVYASPEAEQPDLVTDSAVELEPEGLRFRVNGVEWAYFEKAYVLLHKNAKTKN